MQAKVASGAGYGAIGGAVSALTANGIADNPAADLDLPKVEERLPKHVLTIEEVARVLNPPDTTTALGVGDRAMLETLYSTGIRWDGDHRAAAARRRSAHAS